MKCAPLLAAALLAGCVTAPKLASLDAALNPYVGRNVRELLPKLGYPVSQRTVMGDEVYTWSRDRHTSMSVPTFTTTTGTVDTAPIHTTTVGSEDVPLHFVCRIDVGTSADGTIVRYSWDGNRGGCAPYVKKLSQ